MTPFTDDEVEHLLQFVGYGTLGADVWFIGMEEAGGGEASLRTRLQFDPVEDCADAHRLLGITKHHWGPKRIQPTWGGMTRVMLALKGIPPTTENVREYQASRLGRHDGCTLLAELMPIPKPHVSAWGYEHLLPQFVNGDHYYRVVKPRRIAYLQQLLSAYAPRAVVCYGKAYWQDYRTLFPRAMFTSHDQFEVAVIERTTVVLTGHFTARSMNKKDAMVAALLQDAAKARQNA